ncbi:MAG: hypothetical protein ACPG4Z_06940 [Chitinophagales bacterium]
METVMIEKEQLGEVEFIQEEVLNTPASKKERQSLLRQAMLLGNGAHNKVKVSFKTAAQEIMTVHTTIWAVSEKYVNFKANRSIPIRAILNVEL